MTNDKNALENVQRRATRYVKRIYIYDASVTQMLNELQWESLKSRREQSRLIMLYNILKQNTYFPLEYIPEFHSETLQYQLQTRSCHMFRLFEPYCHTDAYKYSFVPCSSRLWNSLPRQIVETTTANSFKSLLHGYFIGHNNIVS